MVAELTRSKLDRTGFQLARFMVGERPTLMVADIRLSSARRQISIVMMEGL